MEPVAVQVTKSRTSRRVTVLVALVAALAVAVGVTAAQAGTGWRTFGKGSAVGFGDYSLADVSVTSENRDPNRLRFVVRSGKRRVDVYWSLSCERGWHSRYRSGDFTHRAPIRREFGMKNFNPDKCTLSVMASPRSGGRVSVALQRR